MKPVPTNKQIRLTATLKELGRLVALKGDDQFRFTRALPSTLDQVQLNDMIYIVEAFGIVKHEKGETLYYKNFHTGPAAPSKVMWYPSNLMTVEQARFYLRVREINVLVEKSIMIVCSMDAKFEGGHRRNIEPVPPPAVVIKDAVGQTVPIIHDQTPAKPYDVTTRICRNCDHWEVFRHIPGEQFGVCRRYPPRVLANGKQTGGADTTHDYWCGEFEGRKQR